MLGEPRPAGPVGLHFVIQTDSKSLVFRFFLEAVSHEVAKLGFRAARGKWFEAEA